MKRKKVIIVISLSIIAIGIYFYLNTGTSQNMTVQKENRITKDTLLEELLQPLDFLYETFSSRINDPYIGVEAGQLVRKYQEIRQEMLYLDSVSGLQIDFIGMTHNDWMSDDKKVMISQDSISSLIHSKKWDIIGHESYDKFGFVTKSDIFSTALAEMKLYSADTASETIKHCLDANRSGDAIQRYIEKGGENVAGTECTEVWRLQQKLIFINQNANSSYSNLLTNTRIALNSVRSVVAVARIAKMAKNDHKKAVIIFGRSHMGDFEWLQQKFGLKSEFYLP